MPDLPVEISEDFLKGVILTALLFIAGIAAASAIRRRIRSWIISRRNRHASRAEKAAEKILIRDGFRTVGFQVRQQWPVLVDGERIRVELIADWIVENDDNRFLVEVKTGALGTSIDYAPTRRQLLEYLCAFDVDGIILMDMNSRRWQIIEFPDL